VAQNGAKCRARMFTSEQTSEEPHDLLLNSGWRED
jgi:hypothetical protein